MFKFKKNKKITYKVKSNKDFLILSIVMFFLCIWAIKDAWYPSDKVLRKHPREVIFSFPVDGYIQDIFVSKGDVIAKGSALASLSSTDHIIQYDRDKGGTVLEVYKGQYDAVSANEKVCSVKPKDTFYVFNQTLAIFSGLASIGCIIIHKFN